MFSEIPDIFLTFYNNPTFFLIYQIFLKCIKSQIYFFFVNPLFQSSMEINLTGSVNCLIIIGANG